MFKFINIYTDLIHVSKVQGNPAKSKITYYFDGKIETQTFADSTEYDEVMDALEQKFVTIGGVLYNPDRISVVLVKNLSVNFYFLGGKIIAENYADQSEVDSVVQKIDPTHFEVAKDKWISGEQLHVASVNPDLFEIKYEYLGGEIFDVIYEDQAAYDAAVEKIEGFGEGGGGGQKKVAIPHFSPAAGNIQKGNSVTITCSTSGAAIHYTTDGTTPTSASPTYSSPIVVNADVTIKAMATKADMDDSSVASASYVVVLPKVAIPTFTPASGEVASGTEVVIACATSGATIYYTTDGSTPTTSSTEYTGPVEVTEAVTIKAIAVKAEMTDSSVGSASYTVRIDTVATPTFSPAAGAVNIGTTVTLSCATSGAEIHYTVDGSAPSASSPVYSTPIEVTAAVTIKAIGIKTGMANSSVATANYTIAKVATPTFSPAAGAVESGTEVTISCSTSGATIHYTTDGSAPTTSSPVYSAPIAITATTTVKALAVKANMADSAVGTANYTVTVVEYYYAGIQNNPTEEIADDHMPDPITQEVLENLTNVDKGVATKKEYAAAGAEHVFTGIDEDKGGRVVYAYPKHFGALTSYITNGITGPIETSFTVTTIMCGDVEYYVYYLTDSTFNPIANYAFF